MNDVLITFAGNVVSDPQERTLETGAVVTNFRLAINPRKYERSSARWVDGETMFVNVSCWRQLATNVSSSVNKGDPVIVLGRLRIRRWDSGERQGTTVEVEATNVGHDLSRGSASFTRSRRNSEPATEELQAGLDYWSEAESSTAA
jgi:single-strand DNA-binding protein